MNVAQDMLMEFQTTKLRERRGLHRKPFVRPVKIFIGRDEVDCIAGFSRDVTDKGLGPITPVAWVPHKIAQIQGHSGFAAPYEDRGEVRWCEAFRYDWFLTGGSFLD